MFRVVLLYELAWRAGPGSVERVAMISKEIELPIQPFIGLQVGPFGTPVHDFTITSVRFNVEQGEIECCTDWFESPSASDATSIAKAMIDHDGWSAEELEE